MSAGVIVLLIAGALLGIYLLWRVVGGVGDKPLASFSDGSATMDVTGPQTDAQRERAAELAGLGGWRLISGGVEALSVPFRTELERTAFFSSSVHTLVTFYPGATGWTGGVPPEGRPTYPETGGTVLVTVRGDVATRPGYAGPGAGTGLITPGGGA